MIKKYEKYKDSGVEWIGEIPEGWRIKKLKHLLYWEKGANAARYTNEFIGANFGDFPVYSGQTENSGILGKIDTYDYEFSVDVLLVTTVGAKAMTLKRVGGKFSLSQNCALIVQKCESGTDINFFFFYLQRLFEFEKMLISLIMQPSLRFEDLNTYSTVVPSLPEQTAIATFLDRKTAEIDQLIANKEKLIALYEEEKTAIINQAVTKGLDPTVKTKPSDIEWLGDIPEHWEVKKLKYVAEINPTKDSSIDRDSSELVVFLPMEKVKENGEIDCELRKSISDLWNGFTFFRRNDVIVAKITPCFENGKGALLNKLETDVGFGSTEFHVLRAGTLIIHEYLYYITKSEIFMKIGEAFMTGSAGQKRVPTDFISEFNIGLPLLAEQFLIVTHIETECSRLDTITDKFKKQIDLFKEYRTTLISEVVTGKIDVRDEVAA